MTGSNVQQASASAYRFKPLLRAEASDHSAVTSAPSSPTNNSQGPRYLQALRRGDGAGRAEETHQASQRFRPQSAQSYFRSESPLGSRSPGYINFQALSTTEQEDEDGKRDGCGAACQINY